MRFDGYSIDECEKDEHGTEIVLYLKDNTEDENYDDYLQQYEIERLIKKYSDYIRYPIEMWVETSKRVTMRKVKTRMRISLLNRNMKL